MLYQKRIDHRIIVESMLEVWVQKLDISHRGLQQKRKRRRSGLND
jgi:hypothetical protein